MPVRRARVVARLPDERPGDDATDRVLAGEDLARVAPGCGGQPSKGSTLPRPRASMLGRSRPPTALATLPSVFEPSSPYVPASGSSPAPTASRTITHARGMGLF